MTQSKGEIRDHMRVEWNVPIQMDDGVVLGADLFRPLEAGRNSVHGPTLYGEPMRGNGIFVHTDPTDRPADVYAGTATLVSGGQQQSYLLLPVVPGTRCRSQGRHPST